MTHAPQPAGARRRIADALARVRSRIHPAALPVALCLCALPPLVVTGLGFGSYVRHVQFFVLPAAALTGHVALALVLGTRRLVRAARGQPRPEGARPWHVVYVAETLLYLILFLAGWGAGRIWRGVRCRDIRSRCEPVFAALDEYRASHGSYPATLDDVPGMARLREGAGIDLRQGRTNERAVCFQEAHDADAVIFLRPDAWVCIVPLERPFTLSLSRFYIYIREAGGSWRLSHMVWTYSVI